MSQSPLFVFRADASPHIGGGHLMRCLTLASGLVQRGVHCVFVCNAEAGQTVPALERSGLRLINTNLNSADLPEELKGQSIDTVVFDHYSIDAKGEKIWRRWSRRIVVIDDILNRIHDCDIIIDPSFGRTEKSFANVIPAQAQILAGSAYIPIRPEFAEVRAFSLERRDGRDVGRVLISTGLSDVRGLSLEIARVVRDLMPAAEIDVILGPGAPSFVPLHKMQSHDPALHVHVDPPFVAPLMAQADLAIGAIGTTTWERCAVGLPSIAIVLASNQADNAQTLRVSGAGKALDWLVCDDMEAMRCAINAFIRDKGSRIAMAQAAANLCDGAGCNRLVEALLGKPEADFNSISLRPASLQDMARIWAWRNDQDARKMSINRDVIPWEDHRDWFGLALMDSGRRRVFVGETHNGPFGAVRFDNLRDSVWRVSISLAPTARGRGLGRPLLREACAKFVQDMLEKVRLRAEISDDNTPSLKIFSACGFSATGEKSGDMLVLTREPGSCQPAA